MSEWDKDEGAESGEFELHSVFGHRALREKELRAAIVNDVHCYNANRYFYRVTGGQIDAAICETLKAKYDSLLYFGTFNVTKSRPLANELIWKWTEATGKYVGCQFWSKSAKELFDGEVVGWPISQKRAGSIERQLSTRSANGKNRPPHTKLTHEHVYPIKDMKNLLRQEDRLT
jgi:hypothetical protein